jgi:hypothetical protein
MEVMGGETSSKLSILTKISNLSVKYSNLKKKKSDRKKWLEVKKELEMICGKLKEEDDINLILRTMRERQSSPSPEMSPNEMTIVRKRRY